MWVLIDRPLMMTTCYRAMERHLPLTVFLPSDAGKRAPPYTPVGQTGTRFTYPGGMKD